MGLESCIDGCLLLLSCCLFLFDSILSGLLNGLTSFVGLFLFSCMDLGHSSVGLLDDSLLFLLYTLIDCLIDLSLVFDFLEFACDGSLLIYFIHSWLLVGRSNSLHDWGVRGVLLGRTGNNWDRGGDIHDARAGMVNMMMMFSYWDSRLLIRLFQLGDFEYAIDSIRDCTLSFLWNFLLRIVF